MREAIVGQLGADIAALRKAGGGELIVLARGDDCDKVDHSVVERHYELITCIWSSCGAAVPPTSACERAFSSVDAAHQHDLSNRKTKAGRDHWARFEGQKLHCVLSYVARLCRRSNHSKSVKICALKVMWRELRANNGADSLEALNGK